MMVLVVWSMVSVSNMVTSGRRNPFSEERKRGAAEMSGCAKKKDNLATWVDKRKRIPAVPVVNSPHIMDGRRVKTGKELFLRRKLNPVAVTGGK